MHTRLLVAIALLLLLALRSSAQSVVPVGKGAYASAPPEDAGKNVSKLESQPVFVVDQGDRAIPSNKWWTQLVVAKFAKSLWAYPLRVDASEQGLAINFPTRWSDAGNDPVCEFPLMLGGRQFKPVDSRAKTWSDWTVSFRLGESADKFMDITLGEGMPYVWVECHGVQPVLNFPKGVQAKYFDLAGKNATLPVAGDCIGIDYKGRQFGVFAPDGTRFTLQDGGLNIEFAGASQYLVICPLPAVKDFEYFHKYAYAIPRDTQLSWKYEPEKGLVSTTWDVTTEQLKGIEKGIIQGWIPHHYRKTVNELAFNDLTYITPRGPMKCTAGNRFVISFPYTGIVPNLPAPKKLGGPNDYDPERMHAYLADLADKPKFGADTYWGGKDILRFGQCSLMSQQIGDPLQKAFVDSLRDAMANWYTYEPGKKDHYFTYFPKWRGLVGIKTSYGSEGYNDHHFHYGYFAFATALLTMHDRQFAADFGPMATLVAKDYANWDRNDKRFPFFRTFDIWAGHSWAGGTSSPGGNNEESSSEDAQSFAGLIFLGQALGDKDMTAAGIMGYATESQAIMEYWFNAGGDVFPPAWKHPVTGMVWGGGKVYGTYFTGDPAWVYGIQWLPASPMLSYLVRDPASARKSYQNMQTDYKAHEKKEPTIKTFGPALGSVMLGYVLMYDPNWVAEQLDTLWNEPGDKIAHNAGEMTVMYYQAHSMRNLGRVDWSLHGSSPTSMVYVNDTTKAHTYIVWNPLPKKETVNFYEGDKLRGHVDAAPQSLTSATALTN